MTEGENGSRKIGIHHEMKYIHDSSHYILQYDSTPFYYYYYVLFELRMDEFKVYLYHTLGPL